jgi:phage replication initiation protein
MNTAFIDFLSVTFKLEPGAPVQKWVEWLLAEWFGDVTVEDKGRGRFGYAVCLDFAGGFAAFGGNENTVHVSITGDGCRQIKDWESVAQLIEDRHAKITRADVAADDFEGAYWSIDWCKAQYEANGFKPSRGAMPKAQLVDDMGSGKGCTFYVGSRESGKLFRGYEKGKEQKDPNSPWFRCEVEYRAVHREIPVEILREPGSYLAGAYACLADLSPVQSVVRTVAYSTAAAIEKAVAHAQKQAGRCLHMLLTLNGGDLGGALARIYRPELPKRLVGKVAALLAARESEETYTTVRAPDWCREAKPHEFMALEKAHRLETYQWKQWNKFFPAAATGSPQPVFL